MDELEIEVVVNDKRYVDDSGNTVKYIPTETFVMFPDGDLGNTWFGTTPAESDLMAGSAANVSITDTGVAVTTVQKVDPVQVETIVSMICLPSFEMADQVFILDTSSNITLDKSTATVVKDSTMTITATTEPAGETVTWSSSDTTKATVAAGVVTGVAAGTATITATLANGASASCVVTVTAS